MPSKKIKGLAAARSIVSIPATEPDDSHPVQTPAEPVAPPAPKPRKKPTAQRAAERTSSRKAKEPATYITVPALTTSFATVAPSAPESSTNPIIRTIQNDVASIRTRIEQVELHSIATVNRRISELEDVELALLGERMDGVEGSGTDLDTRLKHVEAFMKANKASNNDLRKDVESINSRFRGLQDVVSSAKDMADLAKATADDALEAADDAREDSESLSTRLNTRDSNGSEVEDLRSRIDALSASLNALRKLPPSRSQIQPSTHTSHTGEPALPMHPAPMAQPPSTSPNNMPVRAQPRRSRRAVPYPRQLTTVGESGTPNPSPTTGRAIVAYGPHPGVATDSNDNPIAFFRRVIANYHSSYVTDRSLLSAMVIPLTDNFTLCFETIREAEAFANCVWEQPPVRGAKATIPSTIPK